MIYLGWFYIVMAFFILRSLTRALCVVCVCTKVSVIVSDNRIFLCFNVFLTFHPLTLHVKVEFYACVDLKYIILKLWLTFPP